MKTLTTGALIIFTWVSSANSAVEPVIIRFPATNAWTGQQLSFSVDIRVSGSFGGATEFTLPHIPKTIIMKLGGATVSSQQIEGDTWFVQTHNFRLFSQATGTLEISSFPVRYGRRDGFTGPVTEVNGTVPASQVEIRRPPGSEGIGFLVTTDSLKVSETWDPQSTNTHVGMALKRTVRQSAEDVAGMALVPLPDTAPAGIGLYADDPVIRDQTERGSLFGSRMDSVVYLMQEPGDFTLPEIRYVWWNPETQSLQSNSLPAVQLHVSPAPEVSSTAAADFERRGTWQWITAFAAVLVSIPLLWLPVRRGFTWIHAWWHSPQRMATRRLLDACHRNDPHAAYQAWYRLAQPTTNPELEKQLRELEAVIYSERPKRKWHGAEFARVFRASQRTKTALKAKTPSLPSMNPTHPLSNASRSQISASS